MASIKNDLLNELRNEKYYLDNEFVRVANNDNISYKERVTTVNEIASRIATIVQTIDLIDKYIPTQTVPSPAPAVEESSPAPVEQSEGDVVSVEAPSEVEHKVAGQTHAE